MKNNRVTSAYLEAKKTIKKDIYKILKNLDLKTDNQQANFGIHITMKSIREKLDSYFAGLT